MTCYHPTAFLKSPLASEAVNRLRHHKGRKSPLLRSNLNYWMNVLDRRCPCKSRRSICCLQHKQACDGRIIGYRAAYRVRENGRTP